jgi:hypothetical protein
LDLQQIADEIAGALRGGTESFRAYTATLLAPQVEFLHDPPQPNDGPMEKDELIAHEARIDAAFARALPDLGYSEIRSWTTSDAVHTHYVVSGHLRGGELFAVALGHVYRFSEGLVEKYVVEVAADDAERLKALLSPG